MSEEHTQQRVQQLSKQLYALQKQYFKMRLLGKNAQQYQQEFIDQVFNVADQLTLNQVIDLQQLIGVVEDQVFKVNLAPPLLGVIGEMIQNQHQQLINNNTPLSSFISDQQVEHWLRKILELDHVFEYVQARIEQTPQIRALCAYWINQNIARYTPEQLQVLSDRAKSKLPPRMQKFINTQQQRLEEKVEEKAAQLFQQQLLSLFSLDKDEYLTLALSVWDSIKHKPVSEFASKGSPLDMEDIFILLYEFWKDFRQNSTVQEMIRKGIEHFYQTFEDETIFYLFQSTGLKVSDIQHEAQRFVPAIVQRLNQFDLLDQFIDLTVASFYEQEETLQLIETFLQPNQA